MDGNGNLKQVTLRGSYTNKIPESSVNVCRGTAKRKATSNIPIDALSEHTCIQDATRKRTTKQLEANYELILALATTLNKHLKKREVIGPESKDLAIKCLGEVIRICEVCIRKEAQQRDSAGTMIVESPKSRLKGEGTAQGRNPVIIERFHGHSTRARPIEVNVNGGESPNNDTSHGVIHTLKNSILPMQSAILSQLTLFGEQIDHPALQQCSLPCSMSGFQRLNTRHPLLEDIFLPSTSFDLLSHQTSQEMVQMTENQESTMTPGTNLEKTTNRHIPQTIMHSEYTTNMRGWQWKLPLSNYDLYLPSIMTYPDDNYHTNDSPVFRHDSSLPNKEIIIVWRHLSCRHAEELFRWDKIFVETLCTTLNCLKHEFTKQNELHFNQKPQANGGVELWKNFHWPRTFFIEHLRHRYAQEYGPPQYLVNDHHIIQFLNTRDTLCSMPTETKPKVNRLFGFDGQTAYRASIGFGSSENMVDVRRFMPQIVVCLDSEVYVATIGEEFVFTPTLWDPHHLYSEIEATTTYTLHPPVSWLKWSQTKKAFVGVPPLMLDQRDTEEKELHITVVAFSFLGLPEGVQYERTVKASVIVHLHPPLYILTPSDQNLKSKGPPKDPSLTDMLEKIEDPIDAIRSSPKFSKPIDQRASHQTVCNEAPVLGAESMDGLSTKVNKGTGICATIPSTQPMEANQADKMHKSGELISQRGHKYDPQIDEVEDSFPIVGDGDSTWAIEHIALRPSFRAWNRQRSYIEQCVTIKGRKMLGLFGRRKDGESDSSETELSDGEGQFLKDIPFLTSCQKSARPEWKVVSNEDEPPISVYGQPRMIYNDRSRADTSVLSPINSDKTKFRGVRHQYQCTLSAPVSTAEALSIRCTIAPTPISVKCTALVMEAATIKGSAKYESISPAMTKDKSSESESGDDGTAICNFEVKGPVPWSPID